MVHKINKKNTNDYHVWASTSNTKNEPMNYIKTALESKHPVNTISCMDAKKNKFYIGDDVDDAFKMRRRILLIVDFVAIIVCMSLLVNRSSICIDR